MLILVSVIAFLLIYTFYKQYTSSKFKYTIYLAFVVSLCSFIMIYISKYFYMEDFNILFIASGIISSVSGITLTIMYKKYFRNL